MKLKNLILSIALSVTAAIATAQSQGFSYQAVVRDAKGELLCKTRVSLRLSLTDETGQRVMYREKQTATTNDYGVLTVTVGNGTAENNATLENVDWESGNVCLRVEIDPEGVQMYTDMGLTKIQPVPYAYYALNGGQPGPRGDKGEKGDDGLGFNYQGYWYNEGVYNKNDFLLAPSSRNPESYSMWIATTDSLTGNEPRFSQWGWMELAAPAAKGFSYRGYWDASSAYYQSDYVLSRSSADPSVNSLWIAANDDIDSGLEPRENNWRWVEVVLPKGDEGRGFNYRGYWWSEGVYNANDYVVAASSTDINRLSMWIATSDNISQSEPRLNPSLWTEIEMPKGEKGEKGDEGQGFTYQGLWAEGTQYTLNDYVIAESGYVPGTNAIFITKSRGFTSHSQPKDDSQNWVEITMPRGEKGDKGDKGDKGEKGDKGMVNRGSWTSGAQYSTGDYVFAESAVNAGSTSIWFAKNSVQSSNPPKNDLSNWTEFAGPKGDTGAQGPKGEKGDTGTGLTNMGPWNNSTQYKSGDYVFAPSTTNPQVNSMWIAQRSIQPSNNAPAPGYDWVEFQAPKGDKGDKGEDGMQVSGTKGQTLVHNGTTWVATSQFAMPGDSKAVEINEKIDATEEEPIFAVRDKEGNIVFAVYPNGVRVYVDDNNSKAARSGFLVTGRTATKDGATQDYLVVNDEGTKVFVDDDDSKAARSGFLVTGRIATKEGVASDYLSINGDGTQVFVDDDGSKAARSGFLVTGRTATKDGNKNNYLTVNDEGTKVFVDDDDSKAARSGFLVTGRTATKGENADLLSVDGAGTKVFVDDDDSKAARSGFLVTGRTATKAGNNDFLSIDEKGTKVFIDDQLSDSKAARSGFLVTGRTATKDGGNSYLKVATDGTQIHFDDDGSKAARSGFLVTGRTATKDGEADVLEVTRSSTRVFVDGSSSKSGFDVEGKAGSSTSGFSVTEKGSNGNAGYMNVTAQNFFAGYNAGKNTTPAAATGSPQGKGNTFIGNQSGKINSTGSSNVFIGESAGFSNTTGNSNVNIGVCAGNNNMEGNMNVLIGDYAAKNSMKPEYSVVLGYKAGCGNMNYGYSNNVFIGKESGYKNQTGSNNVFIGKESGYNNTTGGNSVFTGYRAGYSTTTGTDNVFIGTNSGYGNTVSHYNIFIGFRAGAHYRYTGTDEDELRPGNTYIGSYAGCGGDFSENDAAGKYYSCMENSFFGKYSGFSTQTGSANTFIGSNSGRKVTTGICNTIVGWKSGWNLTTGSYNTYIGCGGMGGGADESFKLRIGGYYTADVVAGTGTGRTLIYGDIKEKYVEIWGDLKANTLKAEVSSGIALRTKSPATTACWAAYFDGDVKVTSYLYGSLYSGSDARLKKDVQTIDGALDKVLKLRGVSYYWKNKEELGADSTMFNFDNKRHIGVIAQELEIEFPELVKDDKEGIKTVEYSGLAPILIEAIKEQQQQIEELKTVKAENEALKKEMEELRKMVEELLKKQ